MPAPDRSAGTLCCVVLLCASGLTGCHTDLEEPPAPRPVAIRLASGPEGGGFLPLGEEFVRALGERATPIDVRLVESGGAVANIKAIQRGDADIGFTFADVAYLAFSGQLGDASPPFHQLRGIAVLQVTPISLVARAGLHIRGPQDLRGRTVGVGPAGSGTAVTARLILEAFGLEDASVHTEMLGFQEMATRLLQGQLDAMFDNAINRAESLKQAAEVGARFVPIEGPAADRLRREYPFLTVTAIPRDWYGSSVHTIGVDGLLICRSDLDESIAYELTRQLFASLKTLGRGPLRRMDVEQAPATPVPLHPGAARYYRERELSH